MQITVLANNIREFVYNQTSLMARAGKPDVECTADNEDALANLTDAVIANTTIYLRGALWPTYEFTLVELAEEDVMLDVSGLALSGEREARAEVQLQYALSYGLLAEWLKAYDVELYTQYSMLHRSMTTELSATLVSEVVPESSTSVARRDSERTDGGEESGAKTDRAKKDTERTDGGEDTLTTKPALVDDVINDPRNMDPRWLEENGSMVEPVFQMPKINY